LSGGNAHDSWNQVRGGGRIDWDVAEATSFRLQGDYFDGESGSFMFPSAMPYDDGVSGGNILARLDHQFGEANEGSLQFYYDRTERIRSIQNQTRQQIQVEWQHYFEPMERLGVTWGASYRWDDDDFDMPAGSYVDLAPRSRSTDLVSGFVQGDLEAIEDVLHFTLGSKFERNGHTGFEWQPSARTLWMPHPDHTVWAAISRAVRTPSRAEEDVRINMDLGPFVQIMNGNRDIDSEIVWAYEAGYRAQLLKNVSVDVAGYFNDYYDLMTLEQSTQFFVCPPFPCVVNTQGFDNNGKARGWGVETSLTWVATQWLRLTANYTYADISTREKAKSTDPTFYDKEGNDPEHQFSIRSRVDLPRNFEFDTQLFWVGKVKIQGVDSYARVDVRLGWHPFENVEFSLVGQNLSSKRHDESGMGNNVFASEVPRSFYGKVTVRWP
jgi:iron complex outermembrane receptor protein